MIDQERLDAENRLKELGNRLGISGSDVAKMLALDDAGLRRALDRLRLKSRHPGEAAWPRAKTLVTKQLKACLVAGGAVGMRASLSDVAQHLAEDYRIEVADDGLVEVDKITDAVRKLVGDLPVAVYHHTSSALLPKIAAQGLIVGKQTNFFNTQAGVYLSTRRSGEPVDIYSKRAAHVYGGDPAVIRVRRRLDQLVPDPDDADLAWAQGVQFISQPVPAKDVLVSKKAAPAQPSAQKRPRPGM